MRPLLALAVLSLAPPLALAQTAEELVQRNIEARGGLQRLQALRALRKSGRILLPGGLAAPVTEESLRPGLFRRFFSLQGMTGIEAWDGSTGWQVSPFGGRKDPELMSADDVHGLQLAADLDGPLVAWQSKGHLVEYLGHDPVDGDDALRLKISLKNGDLLYCWLDPDSALVIREEERQTVRGAVREAVHEYGSYKRFGGVFFATSIRGGTKADPSDWSTVTWTRIEVDPPLAASLFAVPETLQASKKR